MNRYLGIGCFEEVFNVGLKLDELKSLNPDLKITYTFYIGEENSLIDVKICKKE